MKKSLMALAVLGAMSATASAQSSVTIYGIVDAGYQWNESGINNGTTAAPRWEQESVSQINSGYQSGSRLGFRGSEALGRGWNAIFTLEAGYSVDTGTSSSYTNQGLGSSSSPLFGRQAWVGLQHSDLGSFVLGRVATVSSGTGTFDMFGSGAGIDPFSTGFGINGLNSTFIPSAALREDNSFLWQSPRWAGFQFGANYSFNINGGEVLPSGNNTTGLTLGANWVWGPLTLAATYDVIEFGDQNTTTAFGNPDQKMTQLGGTWDFKIVKIHGAYAIQDNIRAIQSVNVGQFNPVAGAPYDNNAWMLGVTVPLFGGTFLASYQYSDADNVSGLTSTGASYIYEPDYDVWGVAYTYPFSRRTNMYIGYGQIGWDGNVTALPVSVGVSQRVDRNQFALGIRHLF